MSDHPSASAAGDCLVIAANQSSRVCASSAVPLQETAPPERQWARVATVGASTPAKRDRVQQAETPRRSTRARKTIFSPPVEAFQTITAEQLHIGHVWALFDDEQLPSWYAVVRGVRRDADGVYRVKVKWLKMREHTNGELAEEFFHEVDDDEEEGEQELEAFSHSAQRTLSETQRAVRIAPCKGEVWAFMTSSNDGVSGFVLYEVLEHLEDRLKCAALIRDYEEECGGALGMSAWMRSPHHEYVWLFGGEDWHAVSHRVPARHGLMNSRLWLDESALSSESSDGETALVAFDDAGDGECGGKDKGTKSRRVGGVLVARARQCQLCCETCCGGYTISCSCGKAHAHPWCVPSRRIFHGTTKAFAWRCATCLVLPPPEPAIGSACKGLDVSITENVSIGLRKARELKYHFRSNNAYFGITQYELLFTPEELDAIEQTASRLEKECAAMAMTAPAGEDGEGMHQPKKPNLDQKQVVITPKTKRTKIFFRMRYTDYHSHQITKIMKDVPDDNIPDSIKAAEQVSLPILGQRADMIVLNMYNQGGSIGVHIDDKVLFKRPIVSLRVGSSSTLTLGAYGLGAMNGLFRIPLERGVLTLMEGLAADFFTHNIDGRDTSAFSSSILFRMVS